MSKAYFNKEWIEEVKEKEKRLYHFLEDRNLDGIIIGRQDNFAWITGGGESRVLWNSDMGFSYLYITQEKKKCVSLLADGSRAMDDILTPLGYEYEPVRWFEKSKEQKIIELMKGKKVISDFPIKGATYLLNEIYKLHHPLTKNEISKCKWLGKKTEEILNRTALTIEPGPQRNIRLGENYFDYQI